MRWTPLALAALLLLPTAAAEVGGVHLAVGGTDKIVAFTSKTPLPDPRVSWTDASGNGSSVAERVPAPPGDPDAAYAARIPASATSYTVEGRSFATQAPPAAGAPTRVAFVADWGATNDSWAIYDAIVAAKPDLLIVGGDLSYANGDPAVWDEWLARLEPLVSRIPMMTAFGNHETFCTDAKQIIRECAEEAIEYAEHFHMPRGEGNAYAFDWGAARFVALDTEAYHSGLKTATDDRAQEAFLRDALAGAPAGSWRIAYYHRSLYTSNTGQDKPDAAARAALEPLFTAGGVDLALSGHVHAYERSRPINGTVYIDSGGGGRSIYKEWGLQPEWSASRSAEFEFVLLDITKDRIEGRALRPDGSTLDPFTLTTHGVPQEAKVSKLVPAAGPLVVAIAMAFALKLSRRR